MEHLSDMRTASRSGRVVHETFPLQACYEGHRVYLSFLPLKLGPKGSFEMSVNNLPILYSAFGEFPGFCLLYADVSVLYVPSSKIV